MYTVGNLVLWQVASQAVKRDFLTYISDDIHPQIKILNMVIHILMHFCSLASNWSVESCVKPKCDVINDVKLFQTVYRSCKLYHRLII